MAINIDKTSSDTAVALLHTSRHGQPLRSITLPKGKQQISVEEQDQLHALLNSAFRECVNNHINILEEFDKVNALLTDDRERIAAIEATPQSKEVALARRIFFFRAYLCQIRAKQVWTTIEGEGRALMQRARANPALCKAILMAMAQLSIDFPSKLCFEHQDKCKGRYDDILKRAAEFRLRALNTLALHERSGGRCRDFAQINFQ